MNAIMLYFPVVLFINVVQGGSNFWAYFWSCEWDFKVWTFTGIKAIEQSFPVVMFIYATQGGSSFLTCG